MLYFAYGSNLCESRLQARASSSRFVGIGRLTGHELRFHKLGRDGTGKADAWEIDGRGPVWGAIAELSAFDLEQLDEHERGYRRDSLTIELAGATERAWVYRADESVVQPWLAPSAWYLEHVVDGGRARGLPDLYLDGLAQTPAIDGDGPAVADC